MTLDEALEHYENDAFAQAYEGFYANRKNSEAQYFLGMLYYAGNGVDKSEEQATYWFKKAAKQGSLDAKYMLQCISATTTMCCKPG